MICRDCGLVVGDRIVDVRSEWRNFADSGDDPSRASRVNDWLPSGGLATEIAKLPTGPNGQNNGQGGGGKMSQWQRRIQLSQGDQNLLSGFDKITHIAEILVLPQKIKVPPPHTPLGVFVASSDRTRTRTQNKAKELYSSFESKRNKSMRCKKDSIVAAIIYMACKEEGVPRTFKEISKETEISEKEIRKYYRALNKILPKGTGRTSASDLVVWPALLRVCRVCRVRVLPELYMRLTISM
jgi:transcription initiation factor TFIIB